MCAMCSIVSTKINGVRRKSYIHNKMKYSEFSRHVQIIFQKKRTQKRRKKREEDET